jgi:hypothetical protein
LAGDHVRSINLVSSYANCLKDDRRSQHASLEFALTRIEQQPRWYSRVGVNRSSRVMDYNDRALAQRIAWTRCRGSRVGS